MTGAAVPTEASKVIRIEKTRPSKDGKTVRMLTTESHSNITEIGTDFHAGDEVLAANQEINPGGIAALTAFGVEQVTVYQQPRIAILATGSELLQPGKPIETGKIYNSNGPMLKRLVEETGGIVDFEAQLPDEPEQLKDALEKVIQTHEIVITDGGVIMTLLGTPLGRLITCSSIKLSNDQAALRRPLSKMVPLSWPFLEILELVLLVSTYMWSL